jgi:hypothetical protein
VGTTNQRSKFRVAPLLGAVLGVASVLFVAITVAHAQQGDSLREAAQNPIADLISVPFQNNTNFDIGRSENTQNVLNIQPVYPVRLNESWNLITRPILPVISQPPFFSGRELTALEQSFGPGIGDTEFGLGDLTPEFFFSPRKPIRLGPGTNLSGAPGQLFSFQPRPTLNLGRESGRPAPALSCSCLTRRCT